MPRQYETSTQQRQQRYSSYGDESNSNHLRSVGSDDSDDVSSVNYLANHLKVTASFDYNQSRNSYHKGKENGYENENENKNESYSEEEYNYEKAATSRNNDSEVHDRASLENNYIHAMSQMNRGDYGPIRQTKNDREHRVEKRSSQSRNKNENTRRRDTASTVPTVRDNSNGNGRSSERRESQSSVATSVSRASTTKAISINVNKRSVSKKDPPEEMIALFGAYGVTGQYFLQRAIEAGYNIQAMILPGMEMEDVACSQNVRLITGSLEEVGKIREVVENATYVVCLLNDCDHQNFQPPIGNTDDGHYDLNNLNFMHNLVPILEESDTCRVMLYEASSLSLGNKGTAPFLSTIVKKVAGRKDWRNAKREQDQIVEYVTNQTKNAHFNYIITRPSGSIRDKPSRKKLAASKSQPGPFPISNTDLAEFTLSALKMEKVYNSCPYVVQDGIY